MKTKNKLICILFAVFSFIVIISPLKSQTLQFCEDVTKSGEPISASSVFNISEKGGYLKFLVNLPYRVGTYSISYEIYNVDADGYETYDNTIYQDVEPNWAWFWKEVTFYRAGRYNVYVYDSDRNFLASSSVRIQYY